MEQRKSRPGLQMTEEEKAEWLRSFVEVEESIDALYKAKDKEKLSYMRMKQQNLF